jgi:hypothetical protein
MTAGLFRRAAAAAKSLRQKTNSGFTESAKTAFIFQSGSAIKAGAGRDQPQKGQPQILPAFLKQKL